jgi:hypothetical protein
VKLERRASTGVLSPARGLEGDSQIPGSSNTMDNL